MEKISIDENRFPLDLEGRLNSILNVVNTELKSVTLLHLDDHAVNGDGIIERISNNCKGGYLPNPLTFSAYCLHSFLPIGAVAKEEVIRDDGSIMVGYRLTESGKKYGLPIAMFSLKWAEEYGESLFNTFGATSSPGDIRAPFARAKILETLYKGKSYVSELNELIGYTNISGSPTLRDLKKLQGNGLINSDSRFNYTSEYVYVNKDGEPTKWRNCPNLTSKVFDLLRSEKRVVVGDISMKFNHKSNQISRDILNHLTNQGFAKRVLTGGSNIPYFLTEKGIFFVENYLLKVNDTLSDGKFLSELTSEYHDMISSERFPELMRRGINLYVKVSPRICRLSGDMTKKRIEDYLKLNPGSTPTKMESGLKVSRIQNHLTPMIKSSRLKKESSGRSTYYYLV